MNRICDKKIDPILILIILVSVTPLIEVVYKLFVGVFLLLWLIINKNFKLIQGLKLLLLIEFFFLLSLVNNYFYANSIGLNAYDLYFCYTIMYGYLLARFYSIDVFFRNLKFVVFNSLVIGLPIFVVSLFFPSIIDYGLNYSIGDTDIHKSFVFLNFHYVDGVFTERFVGFGPEPGYTQIFMNILLYIYLVTEKKFSWASALIIISILLTKSTAGIFCMIAIIILSISKFLTRYKLLLLVGLIVILPELSYHFDNKLFGSESFDGRFLRYIYTYNSFDILEIFFGKGSDFYNLHLKLNDLGGFDSFLQILQRYGLISCLLILLLLFFANNMSIFFIFSVALFSQTIILSPIFWYFIFGDSLQKSTADQSTRCNKD